MPVHSTTLEKFKLRHHPAATIVDGGDEGGSGSSENLDLRDQDHC
jgi:hypothetical protein